MNVQLWIAVLLFFLSPHTSHANTQEQSVTSSAAGRTKFGFHGTVRTCVEERTLAENRRLITYQEFNPDGRLLTWRSSNPDGSEWVSTTTYDPDGRVVKITSGKLGEPSTQQLYTYDDAGRMVSITNNENGNRTDFHYDEQGHKREIQTFDPKTLQQRTQNTAFSGSAWNAAEAGFGVPAGGSVTTIYDENDRPVEMQIRDADAHVVSRVVRTYNEAGLVMDEKPTLENPTSLLDKLPVGKRSELNDAQAQTMSALLRGQAERTAFFTYDAEGRVTDKREIGGVFQKRTITSYNDQGDVAEEHTTLTSTLAVGVQYSIDESGTLNPGAAPDVLSDEDVRYSYQYDEHGNWTQQAATALTHPDSAPTVRRRTLTYY